MFRILVVLIAAMVAAPADARDLYRDANHFVAEIRTAIGTDRTGRALDDVLDPMEITPSITASIFEALANASVDMSNLGFSVVTLREMSGGGVTMTGMIYDERPLIYLGVTLGRLPDGLIPVSINVNSNYKNVLPYH